MKAFANRREAGRVLGALLEPYRALKPTVLALPRGGVPVAYEVARALDAPLDVFVVRKLGAPGNVELAMGAIASGGALMLNEDVLAQLQVDRAELRRVIGVETREVARREAAYRGRHPAAPVEGRPVIVVDDGVATGASLRVALDALRSAAPRHIVAATPVASREAMGLLRKHCDDWVCVMTPDPFSSVGTWYRDFAQVSDDEARMLLDRAARHEWVDEAPMLSRSW